MHTTALRKIALLALGLLVVLTGLGLGSSPASAAAPTAPVRLLGAGYEDFIRIYFAPPEISHKPVTNYRIERFVEGQGQPDKVWNQPTTAALVDTTAVEGVTYVYRVRATNADGHSAWSQDQKASLQPFKTEYAKFGTDIGAFVTRQYQDFLGRNPSLGEKQTAVLNIKNGTWSTGDVIDILLAKPERAHRGQIFRLYNAYFDRNADHAGVEYWSEQITELGKTINVVSQSFASSPEFKAVYGNLTNSQFVTLVYQNVLDRNPKADELAYWVNALGSGQLTRGKVMTHFSESPEYKAHSRGRVVVGDVYDAMLGYAANPTDLGNWAPHVQGGGTGGDYGTRLMLLLAY